MKLYITALFILLSGFFVYSAAQSSSLAKSQKWLSNKGFWIIESNKKTPKKATIFFYNNDQHLVYKESIQNKIVNIKRIRVRKQLEEVLVQAITNWEKEKIMTENQQLVAKRL